MKQKTGRKLLSFLLTLAMLVGLMPGMGLTAYADNTEELLTTLTFGGSSTYSETKSGVVSVTATNVTSYSDAYGWLFFDVGSLSVTAEEGYTINKCVFRQNNKQPITDTEAPFEIHSSDRGCITEDTNWDMDGVTSIEVYGYASKAAQTITAEDVTVTYGDTDKSVSATVTEPTTGGGEISYVVKSGSEDYIDVASDGKLTIKKVPSDGKAYVTVTAAATDDYAQATKEVTVTINTKAMTVSAEDVNATVDGQSHGITVNVTDPASGATVKYGTEEGSYTLDASPTQTEVGTQTVYYQVTADNYTTYIGSATVTVSDKGTQTITASDVTATYGDTNKKVEATTDGNGAISYAVKDGSADYIDVDASTGTLTIKKVGTATVIVTAAETATYAKATKEVTVTINKANAVAATVTANNRTYDGTDKPLVNVDNSTLVGGEMWYALGENATTAPEDNLYTTSIPAKTEAGTYYVWYKAVGDANHTNSEAKCITVTIGRRSSGGGGGSSSSGGGSSTPSTPTTPTESYTVPVSSENTVNVTTNISNGTAVVSEITQSDIDKIVNDGNNSGSGDNTEASENTSITIDVSQAKSEVTSVQLSEKTVEKLTEAVKADNNVESVEIKMTNATIELDGTALSAVSEQAEGSSIKLVVEDTQTTKLNATQQESLKQFASAKPFQAYFESNGKEIHDFKGGKATVSIKFLPESGRDVKHYHMYYLPVTGAIERYVTRYAGGMLSFVTTHFSDYAIVYDETMENETGKDTGTGDGSSETGDGANTNADGTVTGDNSESGNVDAGDESQTDTLSDSTANGKTAYQNAISINKGLKVSQTGNKLNISWGKVSGADRYEVYAAYCGKKFGKNPVKIVTGAGVTTAVIKKLDGKKLNLKKNFKVYVVAYKTVSGKKQKLGKTIVAHVIGRKNAAYTNIKAIKLEKSKATIKKGKTWRIKATVVLVDSSKKMLPESHAATFRYASSNKKIATVNKNGKVKAKKKGTCYIWIYAKNGCAKKIKVTVQ